MLVKHLSKTEFDIFFNSGWENWARFQLKGKHLVQTKGVTVPTNIQSFLTKRYCKE